MDIKPEDSQKLVENIRGQARRWKAQRCACRVYGYPGCSSRPAKLIKASPLPLPPRDPLPMRTKPLLPSNVPLENSDTIPARVRPRWVSKVEIKYLRNALVVVGKLYIFLSRTSLERSNSVRAISQVEKSLRSPWRMIDSSGITLSASAMERRSLAVVTHAVVLPPKYKISKTELRLHECAHIVQQTR